MSTNNDPQTAPGSPSPLGISYHSRGINFAIYAPRATEISLVLEFSDDGRVSGELTELSLDPRSNKSGGIWHIELKDQKPPFNYGYRINGTSDPRTGVRFYPDRVLIDPYAKHLSPRAWGKEGSYGRKPVCRAVYEAPFDWKGDSPPKTPLSETIIYELHVRGFTRHPSSNVSHPGTFRGIIEKIPYLKSLGVTAVELLPVAEWDECDNRFRNPFTNHPLLNYWGYNPLSFFALKSGFCSANPSISHEFKGLVRALHEADIEVIVDVVYNHTGETDYEGSTTSFRGIDNPTYYLLQDDGSYQNFTGCGNTFNCNNIVARELLLESLRYWVREMHVDGFRFDLAAIFSRNEAGEVIDNAPLIELICTDPVLKNIKLIAEAWDASGLYQVGSFSRNSRWLEWNGRYRDDVRRFLAGHSDSVRHLATRIAGSSDLYEESGRFPLNSINFITSHDGFTLMDLVSYEEKRNDANGEGNQDGERHNLSWNSGFEGFPCPPQIARIRQRRMRTFFGLLLLSQGTPMITAGDEFGKSQGGNNNSWCQDNETSWLDWSLADTNAELLRFVHLCIALRKQYPLFRRSHFFQVQDGLSASAREVSWQSLYPGHQDWSAECTSLGVLLHRTGVDPWCDSDFFFMTNGSRSNPVDFEVPAVPSPPPSREWRKIMDTSAPSPVDIVTYELGESIAAGTSVRVEPMGLVTLQSKV